MKQNREFQLYQIAEDQAGYFTMEQASEIGFQRNQVYRELDRGKLKRVNRGVYRFVQFPSMRFEEIHAAVLYAGKDAVIGFETALYVYDLSDNIPDEIHVILPRTNSRRKTGIRVHTVQLSEDEVTSFEGLPMTTVERTIVDCVFARSLEVDQIRLAILQALERGMITKQQLLAQSQRRSENMRKIFLSLMDA
jgi:predicted transcriptional regulator of viral defense system